MASDQTPAVLVARFLKAHHYDKTLYAFLTETNLSEKDAVTNPGDWTLEKLLQEKIQFDASLNFERRDGYVDHGWSLPAPSKAKEPELPINSNVLCIKGGRPPGKALAISTANNICSFIETQPPYAVYAHQCFRADSPVLSVAFLSSHYTVTTTMSGKVMLHDFNTGDIISERRDHSKWAVQVACIKAPDDEDRFLVATAGWDQRINLYSLRHISPTASASSSSDGLSALTTPAHSITLSSNPEALVFITNPDNKKLYLVVSRRDSSFLYYYRVDFNNEPLISVPPRAPQIHKPFISLVSAGRQNLAPHSNAWVAFTPSSLALHPHDPTLLAIATSHLPHLKVIVVRLLFPDTTTRPETAQQTAAAVARADLALQDKEDAAIALQVSTQAPQTPYSTPQIAWRPDGSGVWVNGDDGVVRGVEVKTGKVVALLRAHDPGSKVRTLWAGYLTGEHGRRREVVASGGFDRKVFIWEAEDNGDNEAGERTPQSA